MRSQTVLAIIATVLLFSCSDDADRIKMSDFSLNIVDAQSVAVVENPIGGRMSETSNNLYKLTTDGSFESVRFVNINGKDVDPNVTETIIEVDRVFDLNASYLLFFGKFSILNAAAGQQLYYTGLLVRKQDGAIFDFDIYKYNIDVYNARRLGEGVFKYDALGNIYFPTSHYGVTKFIADNPDELSTIDYLPTGQKAYHFDVASDGSCIYYYHGYTSFRLKKPTGGVFEVKINNRGSFDFWTGTNGSIYFSTATWERDPVRRIEDYASMIHKINITTEEVSIDTVWADITFDHTVVARASGSHRIQRENSVVFVDPYYGQGFEFFEDSNTVVNIALPETPSGSKIVNSKDFYYIASGTDLYKVSFDTQEYVKLLKTGEYEVYSLNVDDSDTVFFSGLRFKDGKMIFAEIDSEGNLTVVDEELDRKATMLQRLN